MASGGKRSGAGRPKGTYTRKPPAVLPMTTPDIPLACVTDVLALIAQTVNQVRRGEVDVKVGNCIGVLCSVAVRALTGEQFEQRLAALEALAAQRKRA